VQARLARSLSSGQSAAAELQKQNVLIQTEIAGTIEQFSTLGTSRASRGQSVCRMRPKWPPLMKNSAAIHPATVVSTGWRFISIWARQFSRLGVPFRGAALGDFRPETLSGPRPSVTAIMPVALMGRRRSPTWAHRMISWSLIMGSLFINDRRSYQITPEGNGCALSLPRKCNARPEGRSHFRRQGCLPGTPIRSAVSSLMIERKDKIMAKQRNTDHNAHVQAFQHHERFGDLDQLITELEAKWTSERPQTQSH
jgi:hypothetical protein